MAVYMSFGAAQVGEAISHSMEHSPEDLIALSGMLLFIHYTNALINSGIESRGIVTRVFTRMLSKYPALQSECQPFIKSFFPFFFFWLIYSEHIKTGEFLAE